MDITNSPGLWPGGNALYLYSRFGTYLTSGVCAKVCCLSHNPSNCRSSWPAFQWAKILISLNILGRETLRVTSTYTHYELSDNIPMFLRLLFLSFYLLSPHPVLYAMRHVWCMNRSNDMRRSVKPYLVDRPRRIGPF